MNEVYLLIGIILISFTLGVFFMLFIGSRKLTSKLLDYRKSEKKLQDRLEKVEEELLLAKKEIQSRDEFLSIASHELKTPLTSMLLQTQAALYNIRNVSLAHFSIEHLLKMLESVENQTTRLSKMINDLLNVSLITTGNLELETQKADLHLILKDVIEDFQEKLREKNYILTYENKEAVIGYFDKIRMEQALTNLFSNAIKYGNNKPIEVILKKHNKMAILQVHDNGIGISKEQEKKIFELFKRAVDNRNYKGLGVGLYITRQIVEAHKGTISVTSKNGEGTTFTTTLPLGKT